MPVDGYPRPATLDEARRDAYLTRLGLAGVPLVDEASLRDLHRRHVARIPFENLDIMLGRAINLEPSRVVDKITRRGRGGFCYELNGAFASLLATIGFDVRLAEARVMGEDGPGVPFDHLCLIVDLGGRHYLTDVGFGDSFDEPLAIEPGSHRDPAGVFRLATRDDGWWDLEHDGVPQFRFLPTPCRLADFEPGLRYHTTSSASHFTQGTVATIRTADGRLTVRGSRMTATTARTRISTELNDAELLEVYQERFGFALSSRDLAVIRARSGATPDVEA